jgi:hypothetical protein
MVDINRAFHRLQTMLDDINKILLIKEIIIEKLNVKNIELKSKIKEGEIMISLNYTLYSIRIYLKNYIFFC